MRCPDLKRRGLYQRQTLLTAHEMTLETPDRLKASFLTSAPSIAACPPEDEPEIAIAGRSNAGKSSVLNQLTGNTKLARASKTPGRTRLLNYFTTDIGGRLVDLPGYGYAEAGRDERSVWQRSVEQYLEGRRALCGLVLVMDCRHPFKPFDEHMLAWTRAAVLPTLVLLNKADKLAAGARTRLHREVAARLRGHASADVLTFSATTGMGRIEAIRWLAQRFRETRKRWHEDQGPE
jgi:GTP-binding protein